MKKRLHQFILLLLLVAGFNTQAQSGFSEVYYGGSAGFGSASGSKLILGSNNDYYLAGAHNNNAMLMHVDSSGNPTWQKKLSSTGVSQFHDLINTLDSNLLAVGSINQGSSTDVLVVKATRLGDTLWTKTFGGTNAFEAYGLCQNPDSSYFVTGAKYFNTAPYSRMMILKLSPTGTLIWEKEVLMNNTQNIGYSVKSTADSGCVVMAESENYTTGFTIYASLVKFKSDGTLEWNSNLFRGISCFGKDVEVMADGYLCEVGIMNNEGIVKTDLSGNVVWSRSFYTYTGSNLNESQTRIHRTPDGNVLVAAGCLMTCSAGFNNIFKIDGNGNLLWTGSFFLNAMEAYQKQDSSYVVLGNGPLLGVVAPGSSPGYDPQIGLIKILDPYGTPPIACFQLAGISSAVDSVQGVFTTPTTTATLLPTSLTKTLLDPGMLTYAGCVSFTGSVSRNENEQPIEVFPNPFTENTRVLFANHPEEGNLDLIDLRGRLLLRKQVNSTSNSIEIERDGLPAGIYFLQYTTAQHSIHKKIIIQ